MERDLRSHPVFKEIESVYINALEPGFGAVSALGDPVPSPDGAWVAVAGSVRTSLREPAHDRLMLASTDGSGARLITFGPNSDTDPQWSPDGRRLTFRSDRASPGKFQLYELRMDEIGEARELPTVPGVAEHQHWSADGQHILVVVAGALAEQADALGSGTLAEHEDIPAWMPDVESSESSDRGRSLWLVDVVERSARRVSREGLNVWEADFLGDDSAVAIISETPGEGAWYSSPLAVIDLTTGAERIVYRSDVQLGYAAGSPDGHTIAVQEAVCSDRYCVAGDLLLISVQSGAVRRVDTAGVDVAFSVWAGHGSLLATGFSALDSAVLRIDAGTDSSATPRATQLWRGSETVGAFLPVARPLATGFVATVSSSQHPPEVVRYDGDSEVVLVRTRHAGHEGLRSSWGEVEALEWQAPDGWAIGGLVARPAGSGPYPLLVNVHGGPIGQSTDRWFGIQTQILLSRGYAVFLPNPRGSTGRGQTFAAAVVGDMGGADAADITSGIDALVSSGLADPARIGIYGGSYGGFMAAWLPAVDDRFKAAVAFSPVTDWYSEHFGSSLVEWVGSFVGDVPERPGGAHHARSPALAGNKLRTPTLLTAGLLDRATPPGQAVEHHRALIAQGIPSDVAIYPQEGHGVRSLESQIDLTTRMVGWFERFMPA